MERTRQSERNNTKSVFLQAELDSANVQSAIKSTLSTITVLKLLFKMSVWCLVFELVYNCAWRIPLQNISRF